jgi:hypothetical protein
MYWQGFDSQVFVMLFKVLEEAQEVQKLDLL